MGFPSTHMMSPGEPLPVSIADFVFGMLEIYMDKIAGKFLRCTLEEASDEMAISGLCLILRPLADHTAMGCHCPW